jgi:hypothetical protein
VETSIELVLILKLLTCNPIVQIEAAARISIKKQVVIEKEEKFRSKIM